MLRPAAPAAKQLACLSAKTAAISLRLFPASQNEIDPLTGPVHDRSYSTPVCQQFIQQQSGIGGAAILLCRRDIFNEVGGQAVLGRQMYAANPWLTERHGYDPT